MMIGITTTLNDINDKFSDNQQEGKEMETKMCSKSYYRLCLAAENCYLEIYIDCNRLKYERKVLFDIH